MGVIRDRVRRSHLHLVGGALLAFATVTLPPASTAAQPGAEWAEGRILVQPRAGLSEERFAQILARADGRAGEKLQGMLGFLEDFQRQSRRTLAFCRVLEELDLLEPMQARFKLPSGDAAALGGFKVVNREKLGALPTERLPGLVKNGVLELIYLHLYSMRNLAAVIGRLPEDFEKTEARKGNGAGSGESSIS